MVILHLHLDELGALYVLMTFGKEMFIMNSELKLDFWSRPEPRSREQWAKERTLVIGGSGDVFDEHVNGDRCRARITGKSAVRLAADHCGVTDPHARALVAEINKFDNEAECPSTHLATILKIAGSHEEMQGKVEVTGYKTLQIITAVHWNVACAFGVPSVKFLDYVTNIIHTSTSWNDADALRSLGKLLSKEAESPDKTLFGLRNIYESLCGFVTKYPGQFPDLKVETVMKGLLEILYIGQVDFHAQRRMVRGMGVKKILIEVPNGAGDLVKMSAMLVRDTSNNHATHSALRFEGAVVSVVMNSKGNISVQGSQRRIRAQGIHASMIAGMETLAAMCRFRDLSPEQKHIANWDMLCRYGECIHGKQWYLDDRGRCALYNGTFTHPAPPTKITLHEMEMLMWHAFIPERVVKWKRDMKVPDTSIFSRKRPAGLTQSNSLLRDLKQITRRS